MTAPAPLTPSSPEWGTIVCDYCQQAPVSVAGYVCWNCQSYIEYLEGPSCDCPHEPSIECRCSDDCSEDCPAPAPYWPWAEDPRRDDGDEAGQGPAGPERSSGEP